MTTAGRPRAGRLSDVLLGVATVAWIAGAALLLVAPTVPANRVAIVQTFALFACGALIVRRTDVQVIGWLLVIPGVCFNTLYAIESGLATGAPPTDWTRFLSPLGGIGVMCLMLLLLVFPSGRLESGLTRFAAGVAVVGQSVGFLAEVLLYAGVLDFTLQAAFAAMNAVLTVVVVSGLIDHARRYRRRPRVEQLQLKWFLVAIVGILLYPVMLVAGVEPGSTAFLIGDNIVTIMFPVTIVVAISRYRLYEIDRIISRTVAYVLVLATLAGLFVGMVTLVTAVLPTQDQFAVAATTIAVVALFNPLRRRVVDAVDRRFNRTRYVAQQVIEQFGRSVQDETDLADVNARLDDVLRRTMAPTTVAVWQPPPTEAR